VRAYHSRYSVPRAASPPFPRPATESSFTRLRKPANARRAGEEIVRGFQQRQDFKRLQRFLTAIRSHSLAVRFSEAVCAMGNSPARTQ
jgi:hypothetical protein